MMKTYIFEDEDGRGKLVLDEEVKVYRILSKRGFLEFFNLPWIIYSDDPLWVPPIWREYHSFFKKENPFWRHSETDLFIVKRKESCEGRIAVFIDHLFPEEGGRKTGFFGFLEAVRDIDVWKGLFTVAKQWFKERGVKLVYGPINGRIDMISGFLYQGFQYPPSILSSYNPKYYIGFIEKLGFRRAREQLLYRVDLTKSLSRNLVEIEEKWRIKGVNIRYFNRLRVNKELSWWIPFTMKVFSNHWGYVPVSYDEVRSRFGIKELRWFIDPHLFIIAERNDEPIGFLWAIPDYNQVIKRFNGRINMMSFLKFLWFRRYIESGKLHLIGVKEDFRGEGLALYMNYKVLLEMKKRNYRSAEIGWVDAENKASRRVVEKTGAQLYKKYMIYRYSL